MSSELRFWVVSLRGGYKFVLSKQLETILYMNLNWQKVDMFHVWLKSQFILWCLWWFPTLHIQKCVCFRASASTLCPRTPGKGENVKICPKGATNIAVATVTLRRCVNSVQNKKQMGENCWLIQAQDLSLLQVFIRLKILGFSPLLIKKPSD